MAKTLAVCVSKAHVTPLDAQPEAAGHCSALVNGRECGLPVVYQTVPDDVPVLDPADAVPLAEVSDTLPELRSPLTSAVLAALAGESDENIQATFSDPVVLAVIQGAWKASPDALQTEGSPPEDLVLTAGDAPRDDVLAPGMDKVPGDM